LWKELETKQLFTPLLTKL